MTDLSASAT